MNIGIVGLGLIGGSLGMALRGSYAVKGVVHHAEDGEYALSAGIADEIASGEDDLGDCAAIIVCTPLGVVRETVERLAKRYPNAVISDVGSVKGMLRGIRGRVIGGHPMAGTEKSGILSAGALKVFTHEVKAVTCNGCTNRCKLTVNTFDSGRRYIGGNQCEKPIRSEAPKVTYSLYDFKRSLLSAYQPCSGERQTIGLPMVLNMYELLPFWHTLFTSLGFGVKLSPPSSKKLYLCGQNSIPSDTVCYPAKLAHGHIQALIDDGVDAIFYPCLSYNFDEGLSDNHFNCPVVAYYPNVIAENTRSLGGVKFIHDYLGIHREKDFKKKFHALLENNFGSFRKQQVELAIDRAYSEYASFMQKVRACGDEYLKIAAEKKLPIIVLSGRPYHLDREINHGIDKFIADSGAVLLSEDSLGNHFEKHPLAILNQWTYHARLFAAARFVAEHQELDMNFVQLVSFGCGVDAITTDEARRILEAAGKIYTQIKIDEITNLGAVKIRLRSLFAASGRS